MPEEIGKVSVFHKGKECDVEWEIQDLDCLSKEDDTLFWSPDFSFEGERWYMGLYPNGRTSRDSVGHIDLCLFRRKSSGPPIHVEFSFRLKTVNGQNDSEKQRTDVFNGRSKHYTEQFLSRFEYGRRKSEFLVSGCLTVVCTLKSLNAGTSTDKCPYCKETLDAEFISLHEKCTDIPIKCPDCSNVFRLKSWLYGQECQKKKSEECSYCKKYVDAENISTHEKKCMDRPIKCPECSEVVLLQKWHDHECQAAEAKGATNISRSSEVRHHDKILQDLKQIFQKQENCDVVLRVKGQEFQVHKVILAARSPVFASTFRNDMKEKETGIVDIEDCDPSIFPDFLCFLYSDDVNSLSAENVFGLFTAADKYDVPDLREMCLEFLKEILSIETFFETLTLALQYSETEVIHLATDFFIKNAENIVATVKWQSFLAENPTQSNELFIKFLESDRCLKS